MCLSNSITNHAEIVLKAEQSGVKSFPHKFRDSRTTRGNFVRYIDDMVEKYKVQDSEIRCGITKDLSVYATNEIRCRSTEVLAFYTRRESTPPIFVSNYSANTTQNAHKGPRQRLHTAQKKSLLRKFSETAGIAFGGYFPDAGFSY